MYLIQIKPCYLRHMPQTIISLYLYPYFVAMLEEHRSYLISVTPSTFDSFISSVSIWVFLSRYTVFKTLYKPAHLLYKNFIHIVSQNVYIVNIIFFHIHIRKNTNINNIYVLINNANDFIRNKLARYIICKQYLWKFVIIKFYFYL